MWNADQLQTIYGTSVYEDCLRMRNSWETNANKFVTNDITKEEWLWARASLQCRAYKFGDLTAFFPFIGFCNHLDKKFAHLGLGMLFMYAIIYIYYPIKKL